ncbi:DUF1329 domain-containing protein [Burkholderia cepacia]|uniref:DUF1329 domain-containing protein n=1 Tax=Burkholderia cepacia TaxID=292 RepID=UPI000A3FC277|nr:DUF1329 domain-containing protein [Burkholderia cepacia]
MESNRLPIRCRAWELCALMLAVGSVFTSNFAGADEKAEGDIPAYVGKDSPVGAWEYGKERGEFWKYRNEKATATIDGSSVGKYADKLTPGQIALFKAKPGYRMEIYPAHRVCGVPDFVAANSEQNRTLAKLDASEEHVVDGVTPGVMFPQPKTGAQAIYNFLLRYRGVGTSVPAQVTAVSPRPGSDEWIMAVGPSLNYYPWAVEGHNKVVGGGAILNGISFTYVSPAALAGQGGAGKIYFNQVAEAYYYFTGQRRVRRMPSYQYDAPQLGYENEYLVDETGVFLGPPIDRFNWKLVGKKELYVPYNSFGMYRFNAKFDSVFSKSFVNPEFRRYEPHRVYVVEATLKSDARHVAHKKVFYLDEDTWIPVLAEDYDAQGNLWKVKEAYPIPVWELGGACDFLAFTQYDMATGRYVTDQTTIGQGKDVRWFAKATEPWMKSDYFTSQALQSRSDR